MTYTNPQQGSGAEAKQLRREAGQMLKDLRLSVEKTQRDLANEIGFEYYTMISQIESGKARVPPAQLSAYAKALRMDPKVLTKQLMRYYDPVTFEVLFTNKHGG